MLNDFREEGRGRQAGRGKGGGGEGWGEGGGRKKHQLVASLTRPLPGMEPATFFFFFFWCMGQHSNKLSHTARAISVSLSTI